MSFESDFQYKLRDSVTAQIFKGTDWANTTLGAVENWPDSLRSSIAMCLNSQFPMSIAWGDPLINIYNDGYLPIVGVKHPGAFGVPVATAYQEIWDSFLKESLERVYLHGEVVWHKNFLLPLIRNESPEECYFTFSYSPLSDNSGAFSGLASIATETTETVIFQRRSDVINHLLSSLGVQTDPQRLVEALITALNDNVMDVEELLVFTLSACLTPSVVWASGRDMFAQIGGPQDLEQIWLQSNGAIASRFEFHGGTILAFNLDAFESSEGFLCLYLKANALVKKDRAYWQFADNILSTVKIFIEHKVQRNSEILQLKRQRESREVWYKLIFENAQDGIMFTVPDGRILAANPASCKLLGYTESEIIARGRANIVVQTPELEGFLEERRRSGRVIAELKIRRQDGTIFPADVTSVCFEDSLLGEERAVLIIRDATGRKLAEQRNNTTAKLEAIGQLVGGISHDFNNYLNVIVNSAEELMASISPQENSYGIAELLLKSSLKAADLTRQLLLFSTREKMNSRTMLIGTLISEIDQIISRAIGEHIKVDIEASDAELQVMVDDSQFQSAILNLVLNARDAMPAGGDLIIRTDVKEISEGDAVRLEVEPGNFVMLSVVDTGAGIPAAELKRVIEPFYTTKRDTGGTGLGLSMVFSFVKLSNGGMEIISEPGIGTTVNLFLPLTRENSVVHTQKQNSNEFHGLLGKRVFLVEDNDMVAASVVMMLEKRGLLVDHFLASEDALRKLEEGVRPDYIITDVVLGAGMDGWSYARQVRLLLPEVPIIVMSGFMDNEAIGIENSPDFPVLRKPFRQAELFSLIHQVSIKTASLTSSTNANPL